MFIVRGDTLSCPVPAKTVHASLPVVLQWSDSLTAPGWGAKLVVPVLFSICTCCSECGAHGASPVLLVCLGQSTGIRVKQAYSWRITKERKARRGSNAGISFKHHANCWAECLSCGITSLAALALPEMTATVILQGLRGAASPGCWEVEAVWALLITVLCQRKVLFKTWEMGKNPSVQMLQEFFSGGKGFSCQLLSPWWVLASPNLGVWVITY